MTLHCTYRAYTTVDGGRVAELGGDLSIAIQVTPTPGAEPFTPEQCETLDRGAADLIGSMLTDLGYTLDTGPLLPGPVTLTPPTDTEDTMNPDTPHTGLPTVEPPHPSAPDLTVTTETTTTVTPGDPTTQETQA